jgi:hypothetical protein
MEEKKRRGLKIEPYNPLIFTGWENEKNIPANKTEKEYPVRWEKNQESVGNWKSREKNVVVRKNNEAGKIMWESRRDEDWIG